MGSNLELFFNEEKWDTFKYTYDEFWSDTKNEINLLNNLNNDVQIAKIVWGMFGNFGNEWIYKQVPTLDNLRPIDCLNDENLLKRLKVALMRMPV